MAHKTPLLGHQQSTSIIELAYLQALKAEAGALAGESLHSASFLWDLSNFYEHVCRERLLERAVATNFPLRTLVPALN
eukprot:7882285-Prorocentrum_lima.AAC.1